MAANEADYFQKVGRSTATTLSAPGYTIGGTSITVASTANLPSTTGITFAIDEIDSAGDRVDGSYNVFRGTVASATSIDNLTYLGGDANKDYSAGATTRVYQVISIYRENRLVDGLVVQHKQTGAHADTITTNTINENTAANGVTIDGMNIKDGYVVGGATSGIKNASLGTEAGGLGAAWSTWTPTLSGRFDDADWTKTSCDYMQIGKTVIVQLSLVATAAAPMGGGVAGATFTLPVTSAALKGGSNSVYLGGAVLFDSGTANFMGYVFHTSTTTATILFDNGTGGASNVTSTTPFTWTTSDEVNATFMYEAA